MDSIPVVGVIFFLLLLALFIAVFREGFEDYYKTGRARFLTGSRAPFQPFYDMGFAFAEKVGKKR